MRPGSLIDPIRQSADQSLEESCDLVARQLSLQLGSDSPSNDRTVALCDRRRLRCGNSSTAGTSRRLAPRRGPWPTVTFANSPIGQSPVLLFNGEQSYNRYTRQLFGDEEISVYGYYKPGSARW